MGLYRRIEDSYYKFMDFLNDKVKLPVYDFFVKPIETRGVPSFPIFVLLILLILGGVFLLAFGLPGGESGGTKLTVFASSNGQPVDGATVKLVAGGDEIASERTMAGGKAVFENVPNREILVAATLEGYKQAKEVINFPGKNTVRLEMRCIGDGCAAAGVTPSAEPSSQGGINFEGEAKLVVVVSDSQSSGLVKNAKVSVYKNGANTFVGSGLSIGGTATIKLDAGMNVYVNVEADGYLPYDGSSKPLRLKAGTNRLSVKVAALTRSGCVGGTSVSCVSTDNCPGNSRCDSTGLYGACVKLNSSCSSRCTPGNNISCVTGDACNGTRACNASGLWGECVKLVPNQCSGLPNYAVSFVRTIYASNATPIAGARLDVYNASNSAAPLVRNKLTDANGSYAFILSNAADARYFAVATKDGFFDEASGNFTAGQNSSMTLSPAASENFARLRAFAIDDENAPVNGASFVVFATNALGQTYRVAERTASSTANFAVFENLRRSAASNITINASKGAADGSASAALPNQNNSVNVTLLAPLALLRFQALEVDSEEPIPSAVFSVTRFGNPVGSCTGVNCTVAIRSGRFYNATAIAAGFQPNPFEFINVKALPGQEINLTAYMLSSDSVEESVAALQGIFEAETGLAATHLVAGREYVARFQLAAKSNAGLSGTGLHVSFAEDGTAFFTGYGPRAAVELAGSSSEEESGCEDLQGEENGLTFGPSTRFQWLDVEYAGARSLVIEARFRISPDAPLDPKTNQGTLTLRYRSFARKGEVGGADAKIYRNPFDAILGVALDSPLESGCDAEANEAKLPVSSTVCNDYVCLWLSYAQGSREGGDGFKAESMKGVDPATRDYEPLLVSYAIDFLKAPASTRSLKLVFASPAGTLDFVNVTNPLADLNDCGSMANALPASGALWNLDLSRVAQCSNYGRFPFRLEGVAEAAPRDANNRAAVALSLVSGTSEVLRKNSWLNITAREGQQANGDAATLTITLAQTQKGVAKNEGGRDLPGIFNAGPVTVVSMSDLTLKPAQQDYSLLQADFTATAAYDVYGAALEVSVPDYAASPLRFVGVLLNGANGGFIKAGSDGVVRVAAGDLKRSAKVSGKALFAPVLAGGAEYSYGKIVLRFAAKDFDGNNLAAVERAPKNVFVSNGSNPPQGGGKIYWFSPGEDNCGGLVNVSYDAENGLSFNGCTDLGMRVSSLMPADAVPLTKNLVGGKSVQLFLDSPDRACFDGIESALSKGVLKYDASKCGKDAYKIHGNSVAGQEATLKFYVPGGTYDEFSQCPTGASAIRDAAQAGFACLKVHVKPGEGESLSVRRIATTYAFSMTPAPTDANALMIPELWVVTNNQQYPKQRTLEIWVSDSQPKEQFALGAGESRILAARPLAFSKPGSTEYWAFKVFEENQLVFEPNPETEQMLCSEQPELQRKCASDCNDAYWQCIFNYEESCGSKLRTCSAKCDAIGAAPCRETYPSLDEAVGNAAGASYWRSNEITMVCRNDGVCSTEQGLRENVATCCKPTIDDWRNMVEEEYVSKVESCPNCKPYTPSATEYNCDARCTDVGGGAGGIATVKKGQKFFDGTTLLTCEPPSGDECGYSCTSFCSLPNCDSSPECGPDGTKKTMARRTVQRGWKDGATQENLKTVSFQAPEGDEEVRKNWPLAAFAGESALVKTSVARNTLFADSSWAANYDVADCSAGAADERYKGIYEFSKEGVEGVTTVSVLKLENTPENYLGYSASGGAERACEKGRQAAVNDGMKNVPLCNELWADHSDEYGTCLASVYSYAFDYSGEFALTGLRNYLKCKSESRHGLNCRYGGALTYQEKRDSHPLFALKKQYLLGSCYANCGWLLPHGILVSSTKYCNSKWKYRLWDPLGNEAKCEVLDAGPEWFYYRFSDFGLASDSSRLGINLGSEDDSNVGWTTENGEFGDSNKWGRNNCESVQC